MSLKTVGNLSILATFLVLFSAMLDPRISAGIAVVLLCVFAFTRYRIAR